MVRTKQEAEKMALKARPNMRVVNTVELEKCYVVNMVPVDYPDNADLFMGGGTRIDKKTGNARLYNPLLEDKR